MAEVHISLTWWSLVYNDNGIIRLRFRPWIWLKILILNLIVHTMSLVQNTRLTSTTYFKPGRISCFAPGSCFPNWLEGKPRIVSPNCFISSCSAFNSEKKKKQTKTKQWANVTLFKTKDFQCFLFFLLTHILVGVTSVCGHIDKQDTLAAVVTEGHSSTSLQNCRVVVVNSVICGCVTSLWVRKQGNLWYVYSENNHFVTMDISH